MIDRASLFAAIKAHSLYLARQASGKRFDARNQTLLRLRAANVDLREALLTGASMSHSHLPGINFEAADLNGTDLSFCELSGARFDRADLRGATLADSNLRGATFKNSDLGHGVTRAFTDKGVIETKRSVSMARANLLGADLADVSMPGIDLTRANLRKVDAAGAVLTGADLSLADFTGANLADVNLKGAILTGTDFTEADLSGANLIDCDLAQAKLGGAKMALAVTGRGEVSLPPDIREAVRLHAEWIDSGGGRGQRLNLSGASWRDLNLAGVDFRGARLAQMDFTGSIFMDCDFTLASLDGSVFNHARMVRAVFAGTHLVGVDFTDAVLRNARFEAVDLLDNAGNKTGRSLECDLTNAVFKGAELNGTSFSNLTSPGVDFREAELDHCDQASDIRALIAAAIVNR